VPSLKSEKIRRLQTEKKKARAYPEKKKRAIRKVENKKKSNPNSREKNHVPWIVENLPGK
jgi:hypothetical protein